MIETLPLSTARALLAAWQGGSIKSRIAIVVSLVLLGVGSLLYLSSEILPFENRVLRSAGLVIGGLGLGIGYLLTSLQRGREEVKREKKIEAVERRVQENPRETQAAWQLARVKLESYLDRNLSQVRSIFWLTVVIMISGFSLIAIGAYKAFLDPRNFQASVLSAVSGVVVSFIGGTFLVLYKSTMLQAKDYVTMLERINAVGMSVQILETLEEGNKDLRDRTTADIARQLLAMYSSQTARLNYRITSGSKSGEGRPRSKSS